MLLSRPFRSPHHTVSPVGMAGGGSGHTRPGEISLAHNGVLFLDELPEFRSETIEVLRQPLEDGQVTVSRISGTHTYPSSFMLVCAMNPCKCGYFGHPSGRCTCSEQSIRNYRNRISGPMMDRIDMHVFVKRIPAEVLVSKQKAEPSSAIAARVAAARRRQLERFAGEGIFTNSAMTARMISKYCPLTAPQEDFLNKIIDKLNLSARAYSRILKLSRTIADLAGQEEITIDCIAEALQYRNLDRLER